MTSPTLYGAVMLTDEQILDEFERRAFSPLRMADGLPTLDAVRLIEGVRALLSASKPATPTARGEHAIWLLEALIDIYDDGRNQAPEERCYAEGAWSATLADIRAFLAAAPAAPAQKLYDGTKRRAGVATAANAQVVEPIHQTRSDNMNTWRDASVDMFWRAPEEDRRIVYAAPQPTQPAKAGEAVKLVEAELLPCPFCGNEAEHIHVYDFEEVVRCSNECCLVRPSVRCELPQECAELWNTRAAAPNPDATDYEALEREHLGDPDKRTGIYAPKSAVVLDGERAAFGDWWERRGPEAVHKTWTEDACWFAWQARAASPQAAATQAANVIDKSMVKRLATQYGLIPVQTERTLTEDAVFSGSNAWGNTFDEWCKFVREYDYAPAGFVEKLRALANGDQS